MYKNKLLNLIFLLLFLGMTNLFAADWYVNQTNGDDNVGQGTQGSPWRSITKAVNMAADGDVIYVAAGVYTNAIEGGQVNVTKAVTIIGISNPAAPNQTQITVDDGMLINPGAAKTVNLARSADNSLTFSLGNGTPGNALNLTSGSLMITGSNVTLATGGTITRSAGSISETPNGANISLIYNGGTLAAGPEVLPNLGAGSITINTGSVTFNSAVTFTNGAPSITVNGAASATFNASVTYNNTGNPGNNAIVNASTGTVAFNSTVNVNATNSNNVLNVTFLNSGTGTLTMNGHAITGANTTVALNNNGNGTANLNGGNFNAAVNNTAGSTINLNGNTTFSAGVTNAGLTQLNAYTLTLAGGAQVVNNTGNIVSTAVGTVGSGTLFITGGVTLNGGGNVPNVSVAGAGSLTLGANTQLDGSYTQNSTATPALTDGGFTMTVLGDWTRQTSNPADVNLTGVLQFTATPQQTWNPGAGLQVNSVVVNKAGIGVGDLTMAASVEVKSDFTITAGRVNLGNYNVRMINNNPGTFNNGGSFYTSTGAGYLIIENQQKVLQGAGTFGNTDIRVGNGNVVTLGGNINLSGILIFRSGQMNANTLTLTNTNVAVPEIRRNVDASQGAGFGTTTLAVAPGVSYDLTYFGANAGANVVNAGTEMQAAGIRNLSQNATTAAGTDVTHNVGITVSGNVTVASGQTLSNTGAGITSTGDATHSIRGTLTADFLLQGTVVTLNGATAAADASTINGDLAFDPQTNGGLFTSNGLRGLNGDLLIAPLTATTGATANVTMDGTTSIINGDVIVGTAAAATLNLSMPGATTNTHTGDITLTAGAMMYARGATAALSTLTGNVTLTAGVFTLGSNVTVNGTTTHTAATFVLNAYNYTMQQDYTRNGTGLITSTGGYLVVANGGAAVFTPGTSFAVPYLMIANGAGNTVTLAGNVTATEELWQFTGNIADGGNNIAIAGDYNYATGTGAVAGTYTGTGNLIFSGAPSNITAGANFTCPNIVVNNTGTTFFKTNDTATPVYRTFSTSTFTQTEGAVDLDGNDLVVTGEGTAAADFIRGASAGAWSMTAAGSVQFNDPTGLVFTPGSSWSVDNLMVTNAAGAANSGTSSFTVGSMLTLAGPLNVSTSGTTGNVNVADGATVIRQGNGAQLSKTPNYLGQVNLTYNTAGPIVTHNEIPSANIINNFSVMVPVTLNHNITVNGTFVAAALTNATTNNKTVTMADGSSLQLNINGGAAFDKPLAKAGIMNLIYNGATNTNAFELGTPAGGAHPQYNGNITVQANVNHNTGASLTINGTLTFNGGNLTPTNYVGLLGDLTSTTNGGWFANPAAAQFVDFLGADNTMINTGGTKTVPANVQFRLNKSSNEAYVTLSGGSLNFSTDLSGPSTLFFVNGVIVTGTNSIFLRHDDNGTNPTQGFDRTGVTGTNESHIVGNCAKLLDATGNQPTYGGNPTVALTRVEFPVGTMPASPPNYRPMAFQFNTLPTSNFTLTVNHVDENPQGENGFPITDGNLVITNYPDFYWLVKSSLTLQPQVKYDIEAEAAGYTDYEEDGIENVRFIRRFDNNINNPWLLQGGLGYDNSTNVDVPTVIVRSAEGAISTQGARFTYSQLAKPPVVTATATSPAGVDVVNDAVTIEEGDLLTVEFTADDPDIGEDATLSLVSLPAPDATYENGVLSWQTDGSDAGTYEAVVEATDGTVNTTYTLTINVTDVNQGPSITNAPTDTTTVKAEVEFSYDFDAEDPDEDNQDFTWSIVSGPAGAAIDADGVFTWTAASALIGQYFDVTVRVEDDNNDADEVTFTLWVFENQAPFFTVTVPRDTIFVGETATITYEAQDPNLDPLTFDFYDEYPEGATLVQNGNTVEFTWTPTTNETAIYIIPISVTDGEYSDSTETRLLVKATTSTLSGTVVYNNTAAGLTGATVTLWQGQTQMGTTATDADGNYSFDNVAPGNYTVTASKTTGWGGNSAADALLAARYAANDPNVTLDMMQEWAADVNNSGGVTNADALTILNRVVGNVTSYTRPDWIFASVDVAVGATDKGDVDVEGIAAGDVNNSLYAPAPLAKESVTFVNDEALQIAPKATFEVPVRISEGLELGSATLRFEYPAEKLNFKGLASKVNAVYNEKDGVVSIAWADVKGYTVTEDGIFAVLEFEATEAFAKKETAEISMLDGELTNATGGLVQAKVSVANVTVAIPETFALSQNYPNPFNPSTTIKYDLPAAGKVSLAIYNSLGQQVANLIDAAQEAGSYEIVWNASSLASGVYFYRITVEGAQNYVMTKKMMLLK